MPEMWLANVVCLHRASQRAGSLQTHISMPALRASKDCRCQIRRGSGEPFITSCSLLNQKDGHAAVSPKSDLIDQAASAAALLLSQTRQFRLFIVDFRAVYWSVALETARFSN